MMKTIALTLNGEKVEMSVEPRTSLADLLRNSFGLTGTHLGCEHGVCGACTIMVDGKPIRSCITYAVQADGSDVRTIEGFDDDVVMEMLRAEFSQHHALQCGFCTPGMLITARDIVTRLGNPGEARVREELAGNLCRCTGYAGIVAAICSVGASGAPSTKTAKAPEPDVVAIVAAPALTPEPVAFEAPRLQGAETIEQNFTIDAPNQAVWAFFRDLDAVSRCIPGATLISSDEKSFEVRVSVKFGPIRASMGGAGTYRFDDAAKSGELAGAGKDRFTNSTVNVALNFSLKEVSLQSTEVRTQMAFKISGLLGQFSRGPLVREFARVTMEQFAAKASKELISGAKSHDVVDAARNQNLILRVLRRFFGR